MGKRLEWTLHKGSYTNGQKTHEKVLTVIRENYKLKLQVKITN